MKYVNMLLLVLMLLFIGVQFNDPDGPIWMVIYAVPAIWAAIAAFKQPLLSKSLPNILLILSIAAAVGGMLYYWPTTPRWWASDVWYETETAREGMGMMIITIVLLIAWVSGRRKVLTK